jgi:hypothetical protein
MHGSYSSFVPIKGSELVSLVKTITCSPSKSVFVQVSFAPVVEFPPVEPLFLLAIKVSASALSTNWIPVIGQSSFPLLVS